LLDKITFIDEATCHISEHVSQHILRIWNNSTPHSVTKSTTKYSIQSDVMVFSLLESNVTCVARLSNLYKYLCPFWKKRILIICYYKQHLLIYRLNSGYIFIQNYQGKGLEPALCQSTTSFSPQYTTLFLLHDVHEG